MTLITHSDKIWTLPGFLSTRECDDMILLSEHRGYQEADVGLPGGSKMVKNMRDNYRASYQDDALTQKLWDKLSPNLPDMGGGHRPAGLNPRLRFYRYGPKQRFKRHIDGHVTDGDTQSLLTFMVYLNDDFEGGETRFDDVTITPKTGTALLFIHAQKHESTPIISGSKYVLRSDIMYGSPND